MHYSMTQVVKKTPARQEYASRKRSYSGKRGDYGGSKAKRSKTYR